MRSILIKSILIVLLLFSQGVWADTVKDATGHLTNIPEKSKRIVTLAPSLGELVSEILSENIDDIVGVTDYTDYPEALKNKPSVGSYAKFSIEKVVSLKPDLIFATTDGNLESQISRLRRLGFKVVVVSTSNLNEIYDSIHIVSKALRLENKGKRLSQYIQKNLEGLKSKETKKKKLFIQIGDQPLVTVGKNTFIQDVIELLGYENIYGNNTKSYPRPSREDVVSKKPDYILVMALGGMDQEFQKMVNRWSLLNPKVFIKDKTVFWMRNDEILRPSSRLIEGVVKLKKKLAQYAD